MKQIESFIHHWPRTVLLMLLGALLGFTAWMFLPRQYTAISRISIGIDYNRTGKLDDLEQDRMLGITEDILHSDEVMRDVFEQSSMDDYSNFYQSSRTSRTNETWSLTITGKDPEELAKLSLKWLGSAYDALEDGLEHATRATALQNELDGLTTCLQNHASANAPSGCMTDPEELSHSIEMLSERIHEEKNASHGLSSAILLGDKNPDQLEIHEASRSMAVDILLGAFCGLLAAFAIVWFPEADKQR